MPTIPEEGHVWLVDVTLFVIKEYNIPLENKVHVSSHYHVQGLKGLRPFHSAMDTPKIHVWCLKRILMYLDASMIPLGIKAWYYSMEHFQGLETHVYC